MYHTHVKFQYAEDQKRDASASELKRDAPVSKFKYSPGSFDTKYVKGKQLGEGSFGTVFKCTSIVDGLEYAVKQIAIDKTARQKQMVESEVAILKKVHGKEYVLTLYDVYKDDSHYYLVTDLCTGKELYNEVTRVGRRLNITQVCQIIRQLLTAVEGCHAVGVIHRDIKEENIMLKTPWEPSIRFPDIELVDFGLSVIKTNKIVGFGGTPEFWAPEILTGTKFDEKVDIWAVGCVMYALLLGTDAYVIDTYDSSEPINNIIINMRQQHKKSIFDRTDASGETILWLKFIERNLMVKEVQNRKSASAAIEALDQLTAKITEAKERKAKAAQERKAAAKAEQERRKQEAAAAAAAKVEQERRKQEAAAAAEQERRKQEQERIENALKRERARRKQEAAAAAKAKQEAAAAAVPKQEAAAADAPILTELERPLDYRQLSDNDLLRVSGLVKTQASDTQKIETEDFIHRLNDKATIEKLQDTRDRLWVDSIKQRFERQEHRKKIRRFIARYIQNKHVGSRVLEQLKRRFEVYTKIDRKTVPIEELAITLRDILYTTDDGDKERIKLEKQLQLLDLDKDGSISIGEFLFCMSI